MLYDCNEPVGTPNNSGRGPLRRKQGGIGSNACNAPNIAEAVQLQRHSLGACSQGMLMGLSAPAVDVRLRRG